MHVSLAQKQILQAMCVKNVQLRFCGARIRAWVAGTLVHTDVANMLIVNELVQLAPGKKKIYVLTVKGRALGGCKGK